VSARRGHVTSIAVISSAGGDAEELVPGDTRDEVDPTWSPDGNSIAFGRLPFMEYGAAGVSNIQIVDLRTHQSSTVPGSDGIFSPRWSPDGRFLSAQSNDGHELLLYEFATHKWTVLARGGFGFNNWSADSKYVYYQDAVHGRFERMEVATRKTEVIVSGKEAHQAGGSIAGYWTAPDPDGNLMFMRDLGTHEVYAFDVNWP
jgi:Tol biopolymer transport system component